MKSTKFSQHSGSNPRWNDWLWTDCGNVFAWTTDSSRSRKNLRCCCRNFSNFLQRETLEPIQTSCTVLISSLALHYRHTLQSSHPSFLRCCYSNHLQAAPLQVLRICLFKLQMCRLLNIIRPLLPSPACCQKTDGNVAFGLLHQMLATPASNSC